MTALQNKSDPMTCDHHQTFPLEPTWTNRRKCIDCGMIYEPGREILWMPENTDELAKNYCDQRLKTKSHDFEQSVFKAGFDAMYAEHERIVKGLVEALEKVRMVNGMMWAGDAIAIADEALETYKRKSGGE